MNPACCNRKSTWLFRNRNLSASQRALAAASFLEYEREQALKRKSENGGDRKSECRNYDTPISDPGRATAKAGAKFGVCGDYVFNAAKVLEKAEPEVIDKIRSGVMSVNEAGPAPGLFAYVRMYFYRS